MLRRSKDEIARAIVFRICDTELGIELCKELSPDHQARAVESRHTGEKNCLGNKKTKKRWFELETLARVDAVGKIAQTRQG